MSITQKYAKIIYKRSSKGRHNMHLDVKIFNDSSESGLAIQKVTARAGMGYGASLELSYQAETKEAIIRALSDAGVRIHSTGRLSLTVNADGLYQCERIKNALDTLKAANFISDTFVRQISESFPNRMGGINPLSGPASYSSIMDRLGGPIVGRSSDVEAIRQRIGTDWPYIRDTLRSSHHHGHVGVRSGLSSVAPAASSFPTDVSLGPNAQKLSDLNFPDETIPVEYRCPLSLAIMSDPVCLEGDETERRFERSWITKWLKDHGTHPTTRQAFELTALQSDGELTTKINEFVQNAESSTPSLKK